MSEAPTSDMRPNVIPAAASATPSGNRRRRLRNTSSSVAAITSRAASSSQAIEPVISEARSLSTTGAPLTVYVPPKLSAKMGILTAWRIKEMACACREGDSEDFRRTWMRAESLVGNRYENRAFGSFEPRVASNTTLEMNC